MRRFVILFLALPQGVPGQSPDFHFHKEIDYFLAESGPDPGGSVLLFFGPKRSWEDAGLQEGPRGPGKANGGPWGTSEPPGPGTKNLKTHTFCGAAFWLVKILLWTGPGVGKQHTLANK